MPGPATAETIGFTEAKLYLYASGSATGSGIGFAKGVRMSFNYGYKNYTRFDSTHYDVLTGTRADLQIETLYGDKTLFSLANSTGAVNARVEAIVGGVTQSAVFAFYSGVVQSVNIAGKDKDIFNGNYSMYANTWSAFGQ